jgi:hypothetical protein
MKHMVISSLAGFATMSLIIFLTYYAGADILERNVINAYMLSVAITFGGFAALFTHDKLTGKI